MKPSLDQAGGSEQPRLDQIVLRLTV